jgi:hypothetical protein
LSSVKIVIHNVHMSLFLTLVVFLFIYIKFSPYAK